MRMAPPLGLIRPATRRSKVDLPQPDGPTTATNSSRPIDSEASANAGTNSPSLDSKVLLACAISIIALLLGRHQAHVDELLGILLGVEILGLRDDVVGVGQLRGIKPEETDLLRRLVEDVFQDRLDIGLGILDRELRVALVVQDGSLVNVVAGPDVRFFQCDDEAAQEIGILLDRLLGREPAVGVNLEA